MRNLTFLEQFSFKLTNIVGSPLSLFLHTILIAGIFSLRFLGLIDNLILASLAAFFSLEALYLAIFIQIKARKYAKNITELEESIQSIREDEKEVHRTMIQVLHLAHQIKGHKKPVTGNGNGHTRAHA